MANTFHQFITDRLNSFRSYPEMWGCNQALEASALCLMEAEVQHYCPEGLEKNPRVIIDAFIEEIGKRYRMTNLPLSEHVKDPKEFGKVLYDICHKVRYEIGAILTIWGPGGKADHSLQEPADSLRGIENSCR